MQRSSEEIRREGLDALRERLGDTGTVRFLEIVKAEGARVSKTDRLTQDASVPKIEETLGAIAATIPKEEWDRLPADLTEDLDHYVHGTPRK